MSIDLYLIKDHSVYLLLIELFFQATSTQSNTSFTALSVSVLLNLKIMNQYEGDFLVSHFVFSVFTKERRETFILYLQLNIKCSIR